METAPVLVRPLVPPVQGTFLSVVSAKLISMAISASAPAACPPSSSTPPHSPVRPVPRPASSVTLLLSALPVSQPSKSSMDLASATPIEA